MSLRNIAIIAHVDHGKTTLVDVLLRQSGSVRAHQQMAERALDSNDLERERGITILAKCTSVDWNGLRINIVDTPGHADFGGEVERILSMVDGALVLVDAAEGPLPQTKFVVGKALKRGLRPMVMINKVDRPDARPYEVHDEVFDLFANLDATEEQLDFPTLFGSGKQGWATQDLNAPQPSDLTALFELIQRHVPAPAVDREAPFALLATILEADPYLGRILTGRIERGVVRSNMPVHALSRDGKVIERGRIQKILAFRGLERVTLEQAEAGDIVAIAGLGTATVADTIADPLVELPVPSLPVDPPTITMTFTVNTSPFAGLEGDKVTSRVIRDRLFRELESNVAIKVVESDDKDSFEVSGRGELQLAVLIENMRREGFELSVGRPRVVLQAGANGQMLEPVEEVVIDVDEEFSSTVVQKLQERKAELQEMRPSGAGKQRLVFLAPSRGLIGYFGEFLSDTRGTGLLNRLYHSHSPYKGPIQGRRTGVLIANGSGVATAYALNDLQARGPMMIDPGVKVYEGMIIGEHTRDNDLVVNVVTEKKLTNIRAAGKDDAIRLVPPIRMTLEKAIAYIADDELVEVTPDSIRLRKRFLTENERKKFDKAAKAAS